MARSRRLSDNWLRSSCCQWRLQFSRLRCLSVGVCVLMTVVCALWNRQTARPQPADWHDSVLDRTIDCAPTVVSDDYNSLFCVVSIRVRVLITSVCASWNQQSSQQQPTEWHDIDLYRTIVCATVLVSDDYNCLVCALSLLVFVCWLQQFVRDEINRDLSSNLLSGTITTFFGQLTALKELLVTITNSLVFALFLCLCSCADYSCLLC